MANSSVKLDIISASELLCGPGTESEEVTEQKDQPFLAKMLTIPGYQRIYSWSDKEIKQLWQSIKEAELGENHHTGSIILYDDGEMYEVVDGQQRLVTLSLILYYLEGKSENKVPNLLNKPARTREEKDNVANAHWVIKNLLSAERNNPLFVDKLKKLQFTTIIIPKHDPDLAYVFFNNQNTKGEQLTDFDLLKAHHLRFIDNEEKAEVQAKKWVRINPVMEGKNTDAPSLHQALGVVVYRLRQIMRKNGFNENGFYIRDEYQSVILPDDMFAAINELTFDTPIQGGTRFFDFAEFFYEKYCDFVKTGEYEKLRKLSTRHKRLYQICECFLFAYFLKFGKSYLAEALFCICATIGKYRYGLQNISQGKAEEIAFDSNLIYFICHAHSPASFIGEALLAIDKIPPKGLVSSNEIYTAQLIKNHHDQTKKIPPVKKDFFEKLSHICQELKHFKVRTVIEKMKADYNFQEEGKI